MATIQFDDYRYPMLAKYCTQFVAPDRPITGRDKEVQKSIR